MKKFKMLMCAAMIGAVTFGVTACGNSSDTESAAANDSAETAASDETIIIKAGHHTSVDGTFQHGLETFRDKLAELSGGTMQVEIYPSGQLGDQTELIQQLQTGTVQMAVSSCADVANFAPNVGILDVPYLFETKQQAWNAMDGDIGKEMEDYVFDEVGIYVKGWISGGTRSVFSSVKPIETVDDMKNLKIRTQPAEVHVQAFTQFGATVTPIAYTELYSALQQHVIDAAENDPSNYYDMKFYEVCKYYSLTEHIQQVASTPILVSPIFYDSLTDEQKGWFDEACEYAEKEQRQYVEDQSDVYIEKLEAEGVQVNEVDKESFIEAIQPFYESYVYDNYSEELVSRIRSVPTE